MAPERMRGLPRSSLETSGRTFSSIENVTAAPDEFNPVDVKRMHSAALNDISESQNVDPKQIDRRFFRRGPKALAKLFVARTAPKPQATANEDLDRLSITSNRNSASAYSLPSSTNALDLLSEEEISELTRTNTKRNSRINLRTRLSHIHQRIQSLVVEPELEALPVIRPSDCSYGPELVRDMQERSNTYIPESQAQGETPLLEAVVNIVSPAPYEFVRCPSNPSLDFEPATIESWNEQKNTVPDSHVNERPSVRISTAVIVVDSLAGSDIPVFRKIEREEHPSRIGPYNIVPVKAEEAADVDAAGESEAEVVRDFEKPRKDSGVSPRKVSRRGCAQPVLATSLMK